MKPTSIAVASLAEAGQAALQLAKLWKVAATVKKTEDGGWVATLPDWADPVTCARTGNQLLAKARKVDRTRLNAWLDRTYGGGTADDRNAPRTTLCEESGEYIAIDEAYEAYGPNGREAELDRQLDLEAKRVRWVTVANMARFASRSRAVAFAKARGGKLKLVTKAELVGYTRETAAGPQDVSWTLTRREWVVTYTTKRRKVAAPPAASVYLHSSQTRIERDDLCDGIVCPVELYPEYSWEA